MMNVTERGNTQSSRKQSIGCLGRMVNLFDLNNGVSGNRQLLTDRPHRDGISNPVFSDPIIDKEVVSRNFSNKIGSGTPIKALIAEELSKEAEPKEKSPNLVAKLMGLETLPHHQTNSRAQRSVPAGYSKYPLTRPDALVEGWKRDPSISSRKFDDSYFQHHGKFKDVYEIRHQSGKRNASDLAKVNDQRMTLVRQKFTEAKRLATDEKGCQSKEFIDAVEVLSSNRELFLKFLQESNSMFSHHLHDMQSSMKASPETKRITVLKPSSAIDQEKGLVSGNEGDHIPSYDDCSSQPTRIVVLKPTSGKVQEIKHPQERCGSLQNGEGVELRDGTILSSVFSNAYIGDDSSFVKSDAEFAAGNVSDTEIMSPVSRHSWDFVNKIDSPFSNSSFSRASCSPESSVCREAKKRLSERWAMMTSIPMPEEQNDCPKTSSTLGEMLSLSGAVFADASGQQDDKEEEQELKSSMFCFSGNLDKVSEVCRSPKGLLRSKSVPASSSVFDPTDSAKHQLTKGKSTKSSSSSLKGRVSSLFFSRIKRSTKEKTDFPQLACECSASTVAKSADNYAAAVNDRNLDGCSSSKSGYVDAIISERDNEADISVGEAAPLGNLAENQDQPSPISVLEPLFDEEKANAQPPCASKPTHRGSEISLRSNLLGKSPPIGSISRTLSWDDSFLDSSKASPVSSRPDDDEPDWIFLLETLLSEANFLTDIPSESSFFLAWHSPGAPLDPSLREKYANLDNKELLQEAKRRTIRSYRKLIFDSVNSSLLAFAGRETSPAEIPLHPPSLVEHLWAGMKGWFAGEMKWNCGDGSSLVVESALRKEVVGKGWADDMRGELRNVGDEIEAVVLEELVEETACDLL